MRRVLKSDSIGIDVGAHSGDVLQHLVALAPQGEHLAFEPIPHLADSLKRDYPNVRVYQYALSETEGETTFEMVVNNPAYSGLRRRLEIPGEPAFEQITVKTAPLDTFVAANTPIAFIKIDVEGAEYLVMRGARNTIRRCRPVIVFEAGWPGAGVYDITPENLFDLVTSELGLRLGLMENWLAGRAKRPLRREQFLWNWHHGPDYYFIAYP